MKEGSNFFRKKFRALHVPISALMPGITDKGRGGGEAASPTGRSRFVGKIPRFAVLVEKLWRPIQRLWTLFQRLSAAFQKLWTLFQRLPQAFQKLWKAFQKLRIVFQRLSRPFQRLWIALEKRGKAVRIPESQVRNQWPRARSDSSGRVPGKFRAGVFSPPRRQARQGSNA